ncbi:MAG TPA: phage tail protein, partial [Bacteroidota bacterium]|nr:phage tail protein [Bacteroidota bacterium]
MAVMRDRPYSNYNFLIEIGGVEAQGLEAGFSEVVLPDAFIDVIEYRNGNDRHSGTRKIPGSVH